MTTKAQLAQYCADHPSIHTVFTGVSFTRVAIATVVALLAGFGIGWYVKGRGAAGVKIDFDNAKTVVTTDAQKIETTVASAV